MAITPTDRHRLDDAAAWKDFCNAARIHHWEEIDPVIHVHGDSAVVAYAFDMSFDRGGNAIRMGGRDLFFLVKEGKKWWAVADQFSPCPA